MSTYFSRAIARASGASRVRPQTSLPFAIASAFDSVRPADDGADVNDPGGGVPPRLSSGGSRAGRAALDAEAEATGESSPAADAGVSSKPGPGGEHRGVSGVSVVAPLIAPVVSGPSATAMVGGDTQAESTLLSARTARPTSFGETPTASVRPAGARVEPRAASLLMPEAPSRARLLADAPRQQSLDPTSSWGTTGSRSAGRDRPGQRRAEDGPGDVHITIGRLEVTAVRDAAPSRRTAEKSTNPAMSLDDYLARRRGGA